MESLSFADLLFAIKILDSQSIRSDDKPQIDYIALHSEKTLLGNQFYHIVSFPQFKLEYVSENISNLLGLDPARITLKQLYSLIHPQDLPQILLASKKLIEFLFRNFQLIQPHQIIVTFDYRIKNKEGQYIRILAQNGMISKNIKERSCKTITLHSDITHYKTNHKIKFDLINYGDPINFIFPDEELNNMDLFFTPREREILTLLVTGKNSTEIGKELFISKHTVDTHRRHMLSKTHLCNTAELVAFAVNNHLF
ncbi:LuxR C-terminal-related transcriptional regulator [Carboxylicivirga linearis]|uniref:PAS domain-containing protein n=1 Tax=Carboxylicivirga linearis TaxID=1628157 RepID=A0ABS5JUT2_9BACT|nr:LuxR C-terminal-related transcriptional regulator [Carboxylicivirga linearis]MBS2098655.1 PAS domain-containing protein [Carboxylicivirga linearis]